MEQLVYSSIAAGDLSQAEVFDIIQTSARNNPARQVTGFLIFAKDRFLQLIEGPGEALDLLLAQLAQDRRHRDIAVLSRHPITDRSFPTWRMKRIDPAAVRPAQLLADLRAAGLPASMLQHIAGFPGWNREAA